MHPWGNPEVGANHSSSLVLLLILALLRIVTSCHSVGQGVNTFHYHHPAHSGSHASPKFGCGKVSHFILNFIVSGLTQGDVLCGTCWTWWVGYAFVPFLSLMLFSMIEFYLQSFKIQTLIMCPTNTPSHWPLALIILFWFYLYPLLNYILFASPWLTILLTLISYWLPNICGYSN